jgi:hypothetical protein
MNQRTRFPLRSLRAMVPGIDHLESRQLLSTVALPVHGPMLEHHHHGMRMHHASVVGRVHSGHHEGADPAAITASAASTSFNVVAQFSNASFAATAAIADNDIWAVGTTNLDTTSDMPLAVHFDGTSWSAVPTPTLKGRADFDGVAAVASNDVWAVGAKDISSTGFAQPLIEHWDGTSWSVVSSPKLKQDGVLNAVTAISTNNVWAVGFFDNFSGDLVEHWDGTSWSVVSSPAFNGTNDNLYGISADASNDVWAVGNSGGGLILHFDGTSWSRTVLPDPRQGFIGLFADTALSPSDVWAVGIGKPNNKCCPSALIEHWNGTGWSPVSSPDPNPNATLSLGSIAAISANDIWAAGFALEHWNGTSWSIVTTPSGVGSMGGVSTLSDGTVVLVAGSAILEN